MIFVKFSQCFEKSQQLGPAKVTKNVTGQEPINGLLTWYIEH